MDTEIPTAQELLQAQVEATRIVESERLRKILRAKFAEAKGDLTIRDIFIQLPKDSKLWDVSLEVVQDLLKDKGYTINKASGSDAIRITW